MNNENNGKKTFDNVQNPQHYTDTKIEPIEVIEDWNLGFCLGNAVKYIKRAGHKKSSSMSMKEKEINDIGKAIWYLNRHLQHLEKEYETNSN